MTKDRVFGQDTPFLHWLRTHPDLPAVGPLCGIVATDSDIVIHRYKIGLPDGIGTRDVQSLMDLEIKTRNGEPDDAQRDTLWKRHLFAGRKTLKRNGQVIWLVRWWGCFFLSLSGVCPECSTLRWGDFPKGSRRIRWRHIDQATLVRILRHDLHPHSLTPQPFRRHHKTGEITVTEVLPLGFTAEKPVIKRS